MFENYLDVNPALYVLLVKIDKKIQNQLAQINFCQNTMQIVGML